MNGNETKFRSVKIVGISGVGKTSLIDSVVSKIGASHMCFSEYLYRFGSRAYKKFSQDLEESTGLVLIDEHLEIGKENLEETYRNENTMGIFLIEADPKEIKKRRNNDKNRERPEEDETKITQDQEYSKARAIELSKKLSIPFVVARNNSFEETKTFLFSFLDALRVNP